MMLTVWTALMALMVACGDDGNGNDDTLLTGFSGVVILAIAVFLVVRAMKKRG
ncbi:MAG: hypothetical protein ACRDZ3_02035 [Acidimicrobiia bacterium]